jgi:anti-anti-sigma factor
MQELFIKQNTLPDGIELRLSGELVFIDSQEFMREIPFRAEDHGPHIVLELSELTFIDSAGLGAVLYVSEALRMNGKKLIIQNANENNLKLLKTIQNVGTFKLNS